MIYTLKYCLKDSEGKISSQGEAKCNLSKDSLSVMSKFGEPLYFSLRDIVDAKQADYKITLSLTSKETLIFSDLGYQYEDFLRQLLKERNSMVLEDELIKEKPRKSFDSVEYVYSSGKDEHKGEGEVKIYGDKLVVVPKDHEPIKIYLNELTKVDDKDYSISITAKDAALKLVRLGEHYDDIVNLFSQIMNVFSLNVQETLQELFPTIEPSIIRSASRLLKEGRTAKKEEIEKISPKIWEELEKKLAKLEIKEEYDYLTAKTVKDTISIGLKKEGGIEYLWFLVPIYDEDTKKPGNAIALESTTSEDSGKATYFFRIMGRKEYAETKSIEDIVVKVNNMLEEINDAMIKTNFKREPIYLPEEKIAGTPYEITLKKMPVLKKLRELFIGRVIHNSTESWRTDVDKLLDFNIKTPNDLGKWQR
jgi:hypothetical protein